MDQVLIDAEAMGPVKDEDEIDRVFPNYEFDAMRAAIAKAEGKS